MKKVILTVLILLSLKSIFAQQINPSNEDAYCPETFYNFIIYVSGNATSPAPTFFIKNSLSYFPDNVSTSYNNGITTINFRAKFSDVNNTQTIVLNYQVSGQSAASKEFDFKKIKSLFHADPRISPTPIPASINAERCKSQTWTISFPNTQYINPFLPATDQVKYGAITQYEYSLPQGWSLNGGTPVTGPTDTRVGTNNVIITSDLTNGDGKAIVIKPINSCSPALFKNNYSVINISRPEPTLSITNDYATICKGNSKNYTINGVPLGATVQWSLPTGLTAAQFVGSTTNQTVTLKNLTAPLWFVSHETASLAF